MTEITTDKPQLTVSMLDTEASCGIKFQRRYGYRFGVWHEEEIIAPGVAMLTGTVVHSTVKANLQHKMDNGRLLSLDQIKDLTSDGVKAEWNKGVTLTDKEAANLEGTVGAAIDQSIALSRLHHELAAPSINPIALEEPFVLALKGYDFDLAGRKDIREENRIIDTKTAGASRVPKSAKTMQMGMYALDELKQRARLPLEARLDYLVKLKTPKLVQVVSIPDMSWIDPLRRRIENFAQRLQSIKDGKSQFTPAQPGTWQCSQKWCGYARTCPFYVPTDEEDE